MYISGQTYLIKISYLGYFIASYEKTTAETMRCSNDSRSRIEIRYHFHYMTPYSHKHKVSLQEAMKNKEMKYNESIPAENVSFLARARGNLEAAAFSPLRAEDRLSSQVIII